MPRTLITKSFSSSNRFCIIQFRIAVPSFKRIGMIAATSILINGTIVYGNGAGSLALVYRHISIRYPQNIRSGNPFLSPDI